MGGDKIHTSVQYYYSTNGASDCPNGLTTLLSGLTNLLTFSTATSPSIKSKASNITSALSGNSNIQTYFANQNNCTNNQRPKAYLNVLFFDERFNFDQTSSYSEQISAVSNPGQIVLTGGNERLASKNGYCYIYISNESNEMVYFDNLTLKYERSAILEETHYYPFGLVMSGISSKAAGGIQNKEKTFQGQRFDDDLGLDWVQFKWRNHDPQIGRFIEIDPLSDKYVHNSTYAFSENKVTAHVELEGLEAESIKKNNEVIDNHIKNYQIVQDEDNYSIQEASKVMYNKKEVKNSQSSTTYKFTSKDAVSEFKESSKSIDKLTENIAGAAVGAATGGVLKGVLANAAAGVGASQIIDASTGINIENGGSIVVSSNISLTLSSLTDNGNKLSINNSIIVTGADGKQTYNLSWNTTMNLSISSPTDVKLMKQVMNMQNQYQNTIVNPKANIIIRE